MDGEIVDQQLFPIMSYGCHLWDWERNRCEEDDQYGSEKRCEKRIGYEEE